MTNLPSIIRSRVATILIPVGLLLIQACSYVQPDTRSTPRHHSSSAKTTPVSPAIRKAISYLAANQVTEEQARSGTKSLPGDWPQYFSIKPGLLRLPFRDSNPFAATFVNHAINHVTERNASRLGVRQEQLQQAKVMRDGALKLMQQFKEPPGSSAEGSYGYWLRPARPPNVFQQYIARQILRKLGRNPLNGPLAPLYLKIYPKKSMIWPDADTTAVIYVSLNDHASLMGKTPTPVRLDHFAKWRDVHGMNRRTPNDALLKPNSGVFLTWFANPGLDSPNDADIVVNANILFALARHNAQQTPGFKEAVSWINRDVRNGHYQQFDQLSPYYGDTRLFYYSTSRAFREGPVPDLKPAVRLLVRELNNSAKHRDDGTVYWPSEDPLLSTACALLTYLNAGKDGGDIPERMVDGAASYLIRCQQANGSWRASWARFATTQSGVKLYYKSDAWTTAIALEALCRYQLQRYSAP